MALELRLYSFSKKRNSTAVPSEGGTVVSVVLKKETSFNNPTFILEGGMPFATYAQLGFHYYFIDDIVSLRNDLWEIVCSIDVLATLRADILSTSAFIEYSAHGSNSIQDDRIVPTSTTTNMSAVADVGISKSGAYLLSAVGRTGVTTYVFATRSILNMVLNNIQNWSDNLFLGVQSDFEALVIAGKQLVSAGSAMSCIRDCRWIPFTDLPLTSGGISFGLYDVPMQSFILTDVITEKSFDLAIPFTRSGFLRLQPYTEVCVYLPFVGNVVLNTPRFADSATLHINFSRNNQSGEIGYQLIVGGETIGCYGGQTAVSVPVGVSNITPQSLVTSAASAIVGATYNPIGAVASAASLQPTVSAVGSIQGGAGAGLPGNISLSVVERGISGAVGNMGDVLGKPLFDTRIIGDRTGYVKTRGVSLGGNSRGALKQMVNDIMDSGAFLE